MVPPKARRPPSSASSSGAATVPHVDLLARDGIRAMLDTADYSPNGGEPVDYGVFAEDMQALAEAYLHGGRQAARLAFDVLARQHPELADLIASDPNLPLLVNQWPVYSLADAYKPREPLRYVVHGLFPLGSVSVIYGSPGTLKSLLMADCTVCVAAGKPWLTPMIGAGGEAKKTTQHPALWLDFDNGAARTHEHFDALGQARSLPADTPLHYVSMPSPWLDMSQRETGDELAAFITHFGAKFVVIDNLGVVSGAADENSPAISQVLSNFRRVAELTGAAIVIIHHQRKSVVPGARRGDSLRGHSSIEAALDLALLVEREEQADTILVTATKVRGASVYPFGALFTFDHRQDSDELSAARFYGVPVEDTKSDRAIDEAIMIVTAGCLVKKHVLVAAVKQELPDVGVNRIRTRIAILTKDRRLEESTGDRTTKLYTAAKHA